MASTRTVDIKLDFDTAGFIRQLRIVAKHFAALADELDGQDPPADPLPGVGRNTIAVRSDT